VKKIALFLLSYALLFAEHKHPHPQENEPYIIEDKSGKSADEIREIAKESEINDKKKISIKDIFEVTDSKGDVDVSKLQSSWENLSPKADTHDWVRTKSGEWFKGKIKTLYHDTLEFDSDEIGIYNFDFKDISQIKTYQVMSVNIEDVALFKGIIRLKDKKIEIIQGDNKYTFDANQIISCVPNAETEKDLWSGKISLSVDKRLGNKKQFDYTAQLNLKRITPKTRLVLDYLGRISNVENNLVSADHRIDEKFDIYLSRNFFWTPLFAEYYTDKFKNIKAQYSGGIGIGYTILDTKLTDWYLSGGPAIIYTQYSTVLESGEKKITSPAFELSTNLDIELSKKVDLKYHYKLTFADRESGTYKHHMLVTVEHELTSWLDLDMKGIWDYIYRPEKDSNGLVAQKSDYQFVMGLGVEF